ncbi:hypothetical protein L0244_39540, partial [bacterium]|nr:hypothetical protein [bacterium]
MKSKPGAGLIPADYLAKTKIVEYKRVIPQFSCMVTLRKKFKQAQVFLVLEWSEQRIISGKIFKSGRIISVEYRAVS